MHLSQPDKMNSRKWPDEEDKTNKSIKKHFSIFFRLNVQQLNYKIIYIYNLQTPHWYNVRWKVLSLNIGFVTSKDERDFKTTAEGLIEQKARLESGNERKPW